MTLSLTSQPQYFIGLMSGTSLDGVDAVLCEFDSNGSRMLASQHLPYPDDMKQAILALQDCSENELDKSAQLANRLSQIYAQTIQQLLSAAGFDPQQISAVGSHGQTIRHKPELAYTLQLQNPALLAELSGIDIVADFRSRDIAAGGQGAPLVPAFHQAVFSHPEKNRVIVNIGGIANLTILFPHQRLIGFDSGPGNMLMDMWAHHHIQQAFDADGAWASSGQVDKDLLDDMLAEPFLKLTPPKSTGRDLFNYGWLQGILKQRDISAVDVQRTLLEFTSITISHAIQQYAQACDEIYLCGGGAYNRALVENLRQKLHPVKIAASDDLGVPVNWVEAYAFAWLARQTKLGLAGNVPSVTGASGERVLGAVYAR